MLFLPEEKRKEAKSRMYKKITLADKEKIESIRKKYNHVTCSHSFVVLYTWRKIIGDELYIDDDIFSLRYLPKGKNTWLFPCGSDEKKREFILEHMNEDDFSLCYAGERDIQFLYKEFPGIFVPKYNEDDCEYIYEKKNQEDMVGKRYEELRRKLSLSKRLHTIRLEDITDENIKDVERIVEHRFEDSSPRGVLKTFGNEIDSEALKERKELGLSGFIMYVDDDIYGAALGFQLSEDTWDNLIIKSVYRDPNLGYYFYHSFMVNSPSNCSYVNEEDDLGIEGLREFKKRLKPDRMNEMYDISLKKIV